MSNSPPITSNDWPQHRVKVHEQQAVKGLMNKMQFSCNAITIMLIWRGCSWPLEEHKYCCFCCYSGCCQCCCCCCCCCGIRTMYLAKQSPTVSSIMRDIHVIYNWNHQYMWYIYIYIYIELISAYFRSLPNGVCSVLSTTTSGAAL